MIYIGKVSAQKLHDKWAAQTKEEIKEALREVYERYVTKKDGCWGWKGAKKSKKHPYGWVYFRERAIGAHRASYELHIGEIPKGMYVLHRCDNPECSNPEHLFLGTYLDNKRDQIEKGRSSVEKLNVEKVRTIRQMLKDGILHKMIAKEFGVSMTTVWCIEIEKTWKGI
jgi:hypothetical protein